MDLQVADQLRAGDLVTTAFFPRLMNRVSYGNKALFAGGPVQLSQGDAALVLALEEEVKQTYLTGQPIRYVQVLCQGHVGWLSHLDLADEFAASETTLTPETPKFRGKG